MRRSLPAAADFRELLALAVPVSVVQLGLMAMGVVDTMVVGRLSPVDLAGVAVGNVYTFSIAAFGMACWPPSTRSSRRRWARGTSRRSSGRSSAAS